MSVALDAAQNIEIYKARVNIIDLLEEQKYDVGKYRVFGINEVNTLYNTNQLDMIMNNTQNGKSVYVKFHPGKILKASNIYDMIEDLFVIDAVLKKTDELIIIINDEPNATIKSTLINIWEQDGNYVNVINRKRLQFNITKHFLVPKHTILSVDEVMDFKKRYSIKGDDNIPDISRFSPVSQVIGIRPGDICKIDRPSKSAIISEFYRICTNK